MEYDHYVSVGIDSNILERPNLNLINESMNKSFNYSERNNKSKIDIIKQCLIEIIKNNLKENDPFGLILFNDQNIEILQSLQFIKESLLVEV